jgi:hypothetical protein
MASRCVADTRCRAWNRVDGLVDSPLCPACLEGAQHDVHALVLDYVDLEQHIAKVSLDAEVITGTRELSVPIALGVEALQRAIWLATTTWEEILREADRLEPTAGPVRDGYAVHRAVRIIEPRLWLLASLPAVAIMIEGPDGPPSHVTGADAVLGMSRLHAAARSWLGLTRLVHEMPGECPDCGAITLRRDDGRETVYCALCAYRCTWDEYRRYVELSIARHKMVLAG